MDITQTNLSAFDKLLEPVEEHNENNDSLINQDENIIDNTDDNYEDNNDIIESDEDVIYTFLKNHGISDPSKLKYEDEDGEIIDIDFNSLSKSEQLTILQELTADDNNFDNNDIELLNYLKTNNLSLEQLIEAKAEEKIKDLINNQESVYSIDDYSDDEIYIADLHNRYPLLSEEELESELMKSKDNEELFAKKISILREHYKKLEDENRELEQQREVQEYEELKTNLNNIVSLFNEIVLDKDDPTSDTLIIEDSDKEDIKSYLLYQDVSGKSQFVKDIENPDKLVRLAWFMTHGEKTISEISRYWKNTISKERKELAKLRKQLDSKQVPQQKQKTVVVNNNIDKKQEKTMYGVWANKDLL